MLERVRELRPVDERQHVLSRPVGQRAQPRAEAANEDHRRQGHVLDQTCGAADAVVGEAGRSQLGRIEHVPAELRASGFTYDGIGRAAGLV